jgi:hypothetical protein
MTDLIDFSFLALLRTLDCDVVLMLGLIPLSALMIRTSESDVVDYRTPHLTRAYDLRPSRSYVAIRQASPPLD